MTIQWKRAKPGTLDLDTLITAPTLGDWRKEVLAALDIQNLPIEVTADWGQYSPRPPGLNFWFAVGPGPRARDAACYASEEANTFYCEILHADRRTQTLQPLLLSDYVNLQLSNKREPDDPDKTVPPTPILHVDKYLKNTSGKDTRHLGAFFYCANAAIWWVDEDQYIDPPLYEPNGAKLLYYDAKKILKPGFTRIYYWHIPSPPSPPSLESFYVNYALTQRTGGGSLAMRVDPLSEVEWTWGSADFSLPRALAIGLQSSGPAFAAAAPAGYQVTNHPKHFKVKTAVRSDCEYSKYDGIAYYKRFKVNPDGTPLPRKNKPADPGPPRIPDAKSLEISRLYRKKVKRQILTKSAGARDDAGTVMAREIKQLMGDAYPFGSDKLSATTYVHTMLKGSREFKEVDEAFERSWRSHIAGGQTANERLPDQTSQEWCHLHGHGDGGPEEYKNFVAGSKHCNTEQLAIELGQRIAGPGDLTARVTAYLFESCGHGQEKIADKTLFDTFEKFIQKKFSKPVQDSRATKKARKNTNNETQNSAAVPQETDSILDPFKKEFSTDSQELEIRRIFSTIDNIIDNLDKSEDSNFRREVYNDLIHWLQSLYVPLPIARWMRYKIYHDDVKIFDHVYDGQSESFDANEGNILKLAVEHAVAHALARTRADPESKILERYNARLDAQIAAHAQASAAAAPGGAASSSSEPGHDDDVVMQEPSDTSESAGTGKSRRRKRNE